MKDIKQYIYTIIIMIVFSSMADLLLPKGNIKKLGRIVTGLIVMAVILKPIMAIIAPGNGFHEAILKYSMDTNQKSKTVNANQYKTEALDYYKQKLAAMMEQQIKEQCRKEYQVIKLAINEDQSSAGFLNIRSVELELINEKTNKNQIKPVVPVSVKEEIANKKHRSGNIFFDRPVAALLKKYYNVDSTRILFVR